MKIRSSGLICQVARQRPSFHLPGSIRRGDGAYLTCKMREHMLSLNLCKNDQESIQSSITSARNIGNKNDPVRIECTVHVHVYILYIAYV